MFFQRIEPGKELKHLIECFWIAQNDNSAPVKEKIIPDGFTEIIFHFGDPYRIQLDNHWQLQGKSLLAGQISKHFFLENAGRLDMLGIKLKPTTLFHLYGLPLHKYTNRVVDIDSVAMIEIKKVELAIRVATSHDQRIEIICDYFKQLKGFSDYKETPADRGVNEIFKRNGMLTVTETCKIAGVGERQLENLFKSQAGLSPKLFARIIRFNYIFQLIQQNNQGWSGLAYDAAYYDQSHFIRNFKNFTGENPSTYSFDEKNMANFFLRKK